MLVFFTASYQQLFWIPNSIGVPEGPLGRVWLSLPHLVSDCSQVTLFRCISLWVYHGKFFLARPFHQPISAQAISSPNCHWNVSLPSGASLWMAFWAGSKGQNITQKLSKRDVRYTAGEARMNVYETFLYGTQNMDVPMLADQQELIYISSVRTQHVVWRTCRSDGWSGQMRERERESQENQYCTRDLMMMMTIK